MKPEVDIFLKQGAQTLLTEIAPALGESQLQGCVYLLSQLMLFSAQEYDRAAEIRVTDNTEMRNLFAQASDHVADAALLARLQDAAQSGEPSLRISELNRSNDALKALLIDLHAHIEEMPGAWARNFEETLLVHLLKVAERRQLAPQSVF